MVYLTVNNGDDLRATRGAILACVPIYVPRRRAPDVRPSVLSAFRTQR